jgi:hypothetical protein
VRAGAMAAGEADIVAEVYIKVAGKINSPATFLICGPQPAAAC